MPGMYWNTRSGASRLSLFGRRFDGVLVGSMRTLGTLAVRDSFDTACFTVSEAAGCCAMYASRMLLSRRVASLLPPYSCSGDMCMMCAAASSIAASNALVRRGEFFIPIDISPRSPTTDVAVDSFGI